MRAMPVLRSHCAGGGDGRAWELLAPTVVASLSERPERHIGRTDTLGDGQKDPILVGQVAYYELPQLPGVAAVLAGANHPDASGALPDEVAPDEHLDELS